jgi:replicative DNA helicase
MSDDTEETGMITVLLERLNEFRLPRLLELKERMDAGETLSDNDMAFLERAMEDTRSAHVYIDRHPEVQPVYARVIALYEEVISLGLANEKTKPA